jgi:hypothetical protein
MQLRAGVQWDLRFLDSYDVRNNGIKYTAEME